ncbi:MAG: translocation/assembly module TamB domain-containing protein [Rhodoblastus sp.]|nr:translocation/assembly module TamB domain-containing protein [Rhodoblastus sp.]
MARGGRILRIAGLGLAGLILFVVVLVFFANTGAGGAMIAAYVSRAASSPGSVVSIGALDNPVSSAPVVRDISIADANGVWLKIDRIDARWRPLALLRGVADVDTLDIGTVDVVRKPAASPAKPDDKGLVETIRTALGWRPPLAARISSLTVGKLDLAQPALGAAASLSLAGAADLGATGAAVRVSLDAKRTDAPGSVAARADIAADGATIKLSVDASEPQGGLLARLADIRSLPPVEIHVQGDGTLDAFVAKLDARAGDVADANGTTSIKRVGDERRVDFGLSARLAALLPKDLAALFEKTTGATGVAAIAGNGALRLDRLTVDASAFGLRAKGGLAADGRLSGEAHIAGKAAQPGAAFSAKALSADAQLSGTLSSPEGEARVLIEEARGPMGRIGHVDLDASVAPASGAAGFFEIAAKGNATGLALADRALSEATGESARLDFRARAAKLDEMDVAVATLSTGAAEFSFSGRAGLDLIDGRARLAAPDLKRFAALAKTDLKGALTLNAALSGTPRAGRIAAALDGGLTQPGVGVAALDNLLGKRLAISGAAALAAGGVSFDKLKLTGERASAAIDGRATQDEANLVAKIAAPDLRAADPRLAGRAEADVALKGSLRKLDATFSIAAQDARAIGRAIPHLSLTGEAHDLTGAATIAAALDGAVDGKPARGALRAQRVGDAWNIDTLELAVDRASVKGAFALDAANLVRGRLTIVAPDLDAFSTFALQKLAGRLDADIALDNAGGKQSAVIEAHGQGVRSADISIDRLDAQAHARDLFNRPELDGRIVADRVRVGGETISKARLVAKPGGNGATALELAMDARGFAITGGGTLANSEPRRLDIAQFSATRAGKRIALAKPASVALRDGGAELKGLVIAAGGGRLSVDGFAGEKLALDLNAHALPLSILALADPSLALDGVADAQAKIGGTAKAPAGDWRVKVSRLSLPQTRSAGLPAIEATARGALSGGRSTVDADVAIGARNRLKITGSAPLGAGALDLAIRGALDAALANTTLSANGQSVAGQAKVDLTLKGAATAPAVGGVIDIVNGGFSDPANGIALAHIAGKLSGAGRDLTISGLNGQTKNGGRIAVAGRVSVDPAAGFPAALLVKSANAQFVDSELASATGDLDLAITGPLARAPRVAGRVTLRSMDVNVPDRMPVNLKPLPGTRQIDAKGFAAQMLAIERKEKARAARKPTFDAPIDLVIAAPDRIFVRGRGLDAEFGGQLKIAGTIQKPVVDGGFDLRRGRMQLLTQRLDITQGKLTFAGGLTPQLAFAAQTTAGGVTANVAVSGPASQPVFAFTSSPSLPQDEVLSRLLFAKASASLTPFQAVQLAMALAQFTGATSGADAFEKMRKALGVDTLDIDAGAAGGPRVGVSRYIAKGVSVGVRTGVKPDQTSVNVGVDVFKNFRVQSETRVDGKTSVGVGVEWEY